MHGRWGCSRACPARSFFPASTCNKKRTFGGISQPCLLPHGRNCIEKSLGTSSTSVGPRACVSLRSRLTPALCKLSFCKCHCTSESFFSTVPERLSTWKAERQRLRISPFKLHVPSLGRSISLADHTASVFNACSLKHNLRGGLGRDAEGQPVVLGSCQRHLLPAQLDQIRTVALETVRLHVRRCLSGGVSERRFRVFVGW